MVEFINYEGERLPIRIKYYALLNFQKETGKSFDEMQEDAKKAKKEGKETDMAAMFDMMEPLLYYSLISGLKAIDPDAKLKYNRKEMFNILEECFVEFTEVMPKFFPTPEETEETGVDAGKKLVGNRQQKRKKEKIDKNKTKVKK